MIISEHGSPSGTWPSSMSSGKIFPSGPQVWEIFPNEEKASKKRLWEGHSKRNGTVMSEYPSIGEEQLSGKAFPSSLPLQTKKDPTRNESLSARFSSFTLSPSEDSKESTSDPLRPTLSVPLHTVLILPYPHRLHSPLTNTVPPSLTHTVLSSPYSPSLSPHPHSPFFPTPSSSFPLNTVLLFPHRSHSFLNTTPTSSLKYSPYRPSSKPIPSLSLQLTPTAPQTYTAQSFSPHQHRIAPHSLLTNTVPLKSSNIVPIHTI
ncbi:hypothetical protein RJT34_12543 [Clitoria ternatea]|uniref:Uncharacterized protein n=1 Tax=Clitoria ternatea TaxID=43366 RepID=A0AAN9JPZ1_CLITE